MIINTENYFLIVLGLIWIIGAVLQDLKRREVDNLWNFSLIAIVLAYRLSAGVFNHDIWFILNGLIGVAIFFILGNLFYYGRFFAGGDAKLLIALGAILPLSYDFIVNLKIFGFFLIFSFILGSIYAIIWCLFLMIKHFRIFKKGFFIFAKQYKHLFWIAIFFFFLWIILGFFKIELIFVAIIIILFPILFVFAKTIEECCMIKKIPSQKISEGDWLYKDILIKGRRIKFSWEGLSKKQVQLIKKTNRKILIKEGIPFTPGFLLGYVALIILLWKFNLIFI